MNALSRQAWLALPSAARWALVARGVTADTLSAGHLRALGVRLVVRGRP